MPTFEIVIQRKTGPNWPVIGIQTRPGEFLSVRSEGAFEVNFTTLNACLLPREYGTLLGKGLFRDEIRDAFTRALTQAREAGEALHLLLTVEDVELRCLHWERLCAPIANWDFLALQQQIVFSHYLPSLTDRRFPPLGRRDLRALLLVAGPQDLPDDYELAPFDIAATVQTVCAALGEIPCDVLASVEDAIGKPDLNMLCERLTAESYPLLHIVCHGRYTPQTRETALYLTGDNGLPVTASQLIERLGRIQGARGLPSFAFLMTCESASPEAENGFGGLGQRLVRELGLPAVLAMTAPITITTANDLASSFYGRLREHGEPDRALSEALVGLMGRSDVTVPAIFSRLGGRALFNMELDRPLTPSEIGHGADLLLAQAVQRAPILQTELGELSGQLRAFPVVDGLSPAARQERDAALVAANQWTEEILDLSFSALALDRPLPPYNARCPFRGLASFRPEDSAFFFGRERLVATLAQRLKEHPFLAVLGASGSGKSSLVLAGLIPALGETPVYLTPGSNPLARLASALSSGQGTSPVVVDQFEELFTLCKSEEERQNFIAALLNLVNAPPPVGVDLRVYPEGTPTTNPEGTPADPRRTPRSAPTADGRRVIITMRADFLGECAPYPKLKAALQAHTELVAAMNATELRRAIEQQAGAVGLRFEADLAEDILDDVQNEPGAMPLLQHALLRLWQRRHGRWLRSAEYRATGGVREAIAQTADEIYSALPAVERERIRDIFLRLTRRDEDSTPGSEQRDTRRRVTLDDLVPAGSERLTTVDMVRRLADARLIITASNPLNGQEEVEVAHEALIQHWPRLRSWLDEDRAMLRLGDGVRDAALEWVQSQRDDGLLVHCSGRLEDAQELAKTTRYPFNQLEMSYLNACQVLQDRELFEQEHQRRLRDRLRNALLIGAVVAAVLMTILGGWGLQQAGEASQQAQAANLASTQAVANEQTAKQAQQQAELAAARANSRQLASQSAKERATHLDLALLLAVEANRTYDTFESRSALLETLAERPQIGRFLSGHAFWVRSLSITSDGTLLSVGYDQTLRRLNLASGQILGRTVGPLSDFKWNPEFLPEGKISASGSLLEEMLWDQNSQTPLLSKSFQEHALAVAIRPDGKQAAVNTVDQNIQFLDLEKDAKMDRAFKKAGPVNELRYSPDGRWLAAAGATSPVKIWDLSNDQSEPRTFPGEIEAAFLSFSPDNRLLAACGKKAGLVVVDLTSGQTRTPPGQAVKDCSAPPAFSGDSELLLSDTQGYPISLMLWDLRANQLFRMSAIEPTQIFSGITNLVIVPDGTMAYAGDQSGSIRIIQIDRKNKLVTENQSAWIHTAGIPVTALEFYPPTGTLISGSADGSLIEWRTTVRDPFLVSFKDSPPGLSSGKPVQAAVLGPAKDSLTVITDNGNSEGSTRTILRFDYQSGTWSAPLFKGEGQHFTLSTDGSQAAWVAADQSLHLRQLDSGQELSVQLPSPPTQLYFSPDGRWLAVVGGASPNQLRILATATLKTQTAVIEGKQLLFSIVFGPDNQTVAYQDGENIFLLDLQGGQSTALTSQPVPGLQNFAFSPDGKRLAWSACPRSANSPCSLAQIGFIDVGSRQSSGPLLKMQTLKLSSLAFSPDGRILAAMSAWRGIMLWDTTAWQPYPLRFMPQGREGDLVPSGLLTFRPDSHYLALVDPWPSQGFNEIYRLDPGEWSQRACVIANRNLTQAEWKQYLPDLPYRMSCVGWSQ
jgi:WD40 repeat protein